jgi:hypothetical protein
MILVWSSGLTPDVDERLRIGAFQAGRSKNDLIRDAIAQFLTNWADTQQAKGDVAPIVGYSKTPVEPKVARSKMAKRKIAQRKGAAKQKAVKTAAVAG